MFADGASHLLEGQQQEGGRRAEWTLHLLDLLFWTSLFPGWHTQIQRQIASPSLDKHINQAVTNREILSL